jgi:hypothetical protein
MERASRLHRCFLRVQARIARGSPIQKTIQRSARSLRGRAYRCDPTRKLAVSYGTFRRSFDLWNRHGRTPAALALHFKSRRRMVSRSALIRFFKFCANGSHRSLTEAWLKFFVRGRQSPRISYFVIRRYFPATLFYQVQNERRAIRTATNNLALLLNQSFPPSKS